MKKSNKETSGTSFHNTVITCTQHQLETVLGKPQYGVSGDEKCQMEWVCETKDKNVVTIYDWKEYRQFDRNEMIEWHIGGFKWNDTFTAKQELVEMITKEFGYVES
jgi:hypothetical protein